MPLRRRAAPLTVLVLAIAGGDALAQGAFSAPLPGLGQVGTANDPAFPPVNGGSSGSVGAPPAPFPSDGAPPIAGGFSAGPTVQGGLSAQDCMREFQPLRDEAEQRGKLIKEARDRHATPDEACKPIKSFSQAEIKMIGYVEKNSASCAIPQQVSEQLKNGHNNTEALRVRVCAVAQQLQQRGLNGVVGPATPVGDFPPYYGR